MSGLPGASVCSRPVAVLHFIGELAIITPCRYQPLIHRPQLQRNYHSTSGYGKALGGDSLVVQLDGVVRVDRAIVGVLGNQEDAEILLRKTVMAAFQKPSSMGRSGIRELHQDWRATKEAASSRGLSGGRKVLEVGDDGSGRCGICSSHVAVRGVLDCCNHEYCFDCIENWSSVSNQCPLCKLQFRFISVENVHDQESDFVEDYSPVKQEREEESWDNETALPFSFPSFFIDEDAVACLEGNKCLVRAGVPLPDEDAADTSVACDSCDRWYHAGCVGFDPSISWGSWLCPRCSAKTATLRPPPTASLPSILPVTTVVSSSASGRVPVAELASNATVFSEYDPSISVSVVGEGESALVLSTFRAAESTVHSPPKLEIRGSSSVAGGCCPDSRGQASIVVKAEEVAYPPLEDKAARIEAPVPSPLEKLDFKGQKPVDVPSVPSVTQLMKIDSTRADFDLVDRRPKGAIDSLTTLVLSAKTEQLDLAVVPLQGLQLLQSEEPKSDQDSESKLELEVTASADLPASYFDNLDFEEQPRKEKRKQATKQDRDFVRAEDLPEPPRKIARSVVKKKETALGSTSGPPLKKRGVQSPKIDSKACVTTEISPAIKEEVNDEIPYTENVPLEDLVHMVKDERTVGTAIVKDEPIGGIESNTAGGVRTRVVMRRDSDGRAAQIVENIRQQMRSAAGYGASDDYGKVAVSDDRFFAAYKAAMVRNNEKSQGVKSQGFQRRRISWLDKMLDKAPRGKAGGVRESLTKKLYAGGVSRKTWDRDWDISFWKEQSARIKKAKLEALDVVEGRAGVRAVKDAIVVKEEEVLQKFKNTDAEGDSLLSRLYVADTSLFPRDNDIKPLYMLGEVKEEGKTKCLGGEKATSEPRSVLKSQTSMGSKSTETKPSLPSRAGDVSTNGTAIPSLQGLKVPSEKTSKGTVKGSGLPGTHKHADSSSIAKASNAPDPDEKKDKRQWARELLARKSGDAMASSAAKGHGGTRMESSLLGQVPEELRPTLPPDRRSRVPTAVRQSQLNRILEHYLRKAKLTSLKAGYKLKSVISSAVAKEREIYDSSNTKGVYVNLCVRALAQQDEVRLQVTIPQPAEPDEAGAVAEALLATGLISDSPPGSPCEKHSPSTEIGKVLPGNQPPEYSPIVKEVPQAGDVEDVLDISKPESSHVYGEMDLDLEVRSSEGSAARVPRPIASSTHPVSSKNNMKVVFTSSTTISSSQVPINREKNPEESSTGRENDVGVTESKINAKAGLVSADQSRSVISAQSKPSREEMNVEDYAKSTAKFSNGRKTKETSTLAKPNKECSTVADEGNSGAQNSKKAELESTLVDAPVRSSGESEGDDWMNSGKFPDLDSRIDKMRKDVLKMSSSFLSQFDGGHVFGGSLHEPTSVDEVRLEGGKTAKSSGIPNRKGNGSNPGGKEPEASSSVQKQVEAYVKEHLKPLYKSGVIKSDQFRYAVSKTASKVMQHHGDAISADFLIVEGSKVKKLADQYLQSYIHKK